MKRSGNHALIYWLMTGLKGLSSFCNDLRPDQFPHEALIKKSKWGPQSPSHLICSYEDLPVKSVFLSKKILPYAVEKKRIIVLRDPYNWVSSWLAWQSSWGIAFREDESYRDVLIENWKDHARTFLSVENSNTILGINYNSWVSSQSYRTNLAHQLNLTVAPKKLNSVPAYGYGSSFEGLSHKGNPQKMDVLNRWKRFESHSVFKEIQQDQELISLSEEIFGNVI